MKKLFGRTTAALSAAMLAVSGCFGCFTVFAADGEEDPVREVKVVYDLVLDKDDIGIGYRKDGKKTSLEDFEDFETTAGSLVTIPLGSFTSEELTFSGWTIDGKLGYFSGDSFIIPDDYDEDVITVKAVWYDPEAELVKCSYDLTYKGEELERPKWLIDPQLSPGSVFEPEYTRVDKEVFFSHGLVYDGQLLTIGKKIIVPDHDFEIYFNWIKKINLTFDAGGVDRIVGNDTMTFSVNGGSNYDLPSSDRFSRKGFTIDGWICDLDGKTYKLLETITLPEEEDITFTPVWKPIEYKVVFITGNGGKNVLVPGLTDTSIICPDPEYTVSGKHFAGWKDSKGDIYPVGSEYFVEGAIPGLGISLKGVWENGESPSQPASDKAEPTLIGDANVDGTVSIADCTTILQVLGNPDKYKLSPTGEANADCYDPGSGVTGLDALAIQKLDAKLINSLPVLIE